MYTTNEEYVELASSQTRRPIPKVLVNGIEVDIISIEQKEPRETFIGGFTAKYIVLVLDVNAYKGTYVGAVIEPFISFKGSDTEVPTGKFKVDKDDIEFDEVQKKYTITAYDDALLFDKRYKPLKFPMTGKSFIEQVCGAVGIAFDTDSISVINFYSKIITGINVNEKEIISYRQIISDFAQYNLCSAHISRDGKLTFKSALKSSPVTKLTGFDYIGLKLDKEVKPINSLVYEQESINDPVFIKDEESIKSYGLNELKLTNNVFIENLQRDQQQTYINQMFEDVGGFIYHTFDSDQVMRPDFDTCDVIEVESMSDEIYRTILVSLNWSWVGGGLKGTMSCPQLPETVTQYELAGERQNFLNMGIKVDRVNAEITSVIEDIDDLSDRTTTLKQNLDSVIAEVESIAVGQNIIPNLNALMDLVNGTYPEWESQQIGLLPPFKPKKYPYSKTSPIFQVEKDDSSLSRYSKRFYSIGKSTSGYGYVIPDSIYSYKCKRTKGFEPLKINVMEYGRDMKLINTTSQVLTGKQVYETFIIQPAQMTMWIRLQYEKSNMIQFNIAEEMFVRGNPSNYQEDIQDIKVWAKSKFEIQSDQIQATVESVEETKSQITQQAEQIQLRVEKSGVIGSINVSPEGLKISSGKLEFDNAVGKNVDLTGKITATSGTFTGTIYAKSGDIGNFKLENNELTLDSIYYTKKFTKADSDRISQIITNNLTPTQKDWDELDVNRDGVFTAQDMAVIMAAVTGNISNPIPMVANVNMGNSYGDIKMSISVDGKDFHKSSVSIQPASVISTTGIFSNLYFKPEFNDNFYEISLDPEQQPDGSHWLKAKRINYVKGV